jgi:hypothetical protein
MAHVSIALSLGIHRPAFFVNRPVWGAAKGKAGLAPDRVVDATMVEEVLRERRLK